MSGYAFREWEKSNLQSLYDDVLVRSVVEFRKALEYLEDHDATRTTQCVEHIQRGLRTMESELSRRGIAARADFNGASLSAERRSLPKH
jgi:hypothetical protein